METAYHLPLKKRCQAGGAPHSLGKLIEWKLDGLTDPWGAVFTSPLAGETN